MKSGTEEIRDMMKQAGIDEDCLSERARNKTHTLQDVKIQNWLHFRPQLKRSVKKNKKIKNCI